MSETSAAFLKRTTCSIECSALAAVLGARWREEFPGAQYQTWDEVPNSCPHCQGRLQPVEHGVRCFACSREWVVAVAMLRRLLSTRGRLRRPAARDGDDETS